MNKSDDTVLHLMEHTVDVIMQIHVHVHVYMINILRWKLQNVVFFSVGKVIIQKHLSSVL